MSHIMLSVLNKETTEQIDYTDLLCWLEANKGDDLLLMESREYKRFIESEIEDDEMDMEVTNTEKIAIEGIAGIDIYDEENFIAGQITENDILLTVKWSNRTKDYVLLYA